MTSMKSTFPAQASQEATAAPPDIFNLAQHLLDLNAARPGKIAFADDSGTLSYGELATRVRQMAAALLASGLRREDRVLLVMPDCREWPVAFLGAIYAGCIPVAVNTLLTQDDYAYMLAHSRAQAILTAPSMLPTLQAAMGAGGHEIGLIITTGADSGEGTAALEGLLREHPPLESSARTHSDEPAFWLYSSGSTGRPKGTVHTHANAYWTAELFGKGVLGVRESDVTFSAAKLFFAYGLGNSLTFPLSAGATVLLMGERPTPDSVSLRLKGSVAGLKPTVFFFSPTGFAALLASPGLPARDEVNLRLVSSASEALPAEMGERFKAHFGVDIIDGIGSTEMLHVYISNRPDQVRYGSTGWPVPGYEIMLRGDDGGPVPVGEPGDLYVKGPSAALMYWCNREKSRETFQGSWTKSGDKYIRNADGTYTYAGRADDMLKVSGLYVSPFEVEATLAQHPQVLEAAVIGVEDHEGLTKTKAFVVAKAGAAPSEGDLKAFVKERLAPYKYPRFIEFVEELPKTATGKIQRFRLRERESVTRASRSS
jgi:benzoate-CoA ligase